MKTKPILNYLLISLLISSIFLFIGLPVRAEDPVFTQDELIVKLKPTANTDSFLSKHKVKMAKQNKKLRLNKIKTSKDKDLKSQILEIKQDSQVEYVEPNYIYKVDMTPNDPYYNLQWSLPKMKVDKAWDLSTGSSPVTIAIVDSGVDADHPDLSSKLIGGYNTINNTTSTNDDNGHGTHVAGIAAGIMDNSKGIAGIAVNSKIMPVKAMDSSGSGSIMDIAEGITWAADHGAKVINLSLGGPYYTQTLQDAIDYAYAKGCLVIAAAGNDNSSSPSYPAAHNHVVAVSATDENNNKAWFSNYGTYVDIAAPGTNIYSTTFDGLYGYKQGTSMACPNVSGVAGLVLSIVPSLTPDQLENILETTALDIGASGRDNNFGYGLVDAYSAIQKAYPNITLPAKGNINNPNSLETVSGTYTVKGWFLDGEIVSKIEILIDGTSIGEADYGDSRPDIGSIFKDYNNDNCGFHYSLDTTKLTSGNHSITIRETSKAGKQTTLNGTAFIVFNNYPPIGSLENPVGLETISGNYMVKGWFLDVNKVSKIEVIADGDVLGEAAYGDARTDIGSQYPQYWNNNCGFHYSLNSSMLSNGNHTIEIRETALNGVQKVLPAVQIKVSNTSSLPPQGDIEQPSWFEIITGKYTIKGWFLDGETVSGLDILIDGEIMGQAIYGDPRSDIYLAYPGYKNSNSGFHFELDTTQLSEGEHTINVRETSKSTKQNSLMGTNITVIKSAIPKKAKSISIKYTLSEASKVNVGIYDSRNVLVRTLESDALKQPGINFAYWDGKNSSGSIVRDGVYTFKISAVDLAGHPAAPITGTITVERLNPSLTSVSDSPDPLPLTDSASSTIKFTLSEKAKVSIRIYDNNQTLINTIGNKTFDYGENSIVWDGSDQAGNEVTNGTYTYIIEATDSFFKKSTPVSGTIKIDSTKPEITSASILPNPFAPIGGNTASISFNLSEAAKISINIYNSDDKLIKSLEDNATKSAGNNFSSWNGKDSSGQVIKDGEYKFTISAIDLVGLAGNPASQNFTVEGTSPSITAVDDTPDPFAPDGSLVNKITYTLSEDAHVTVKVFDSSNTLIKTLIDENLEAGDKSTNWNGKNDSGSIVKSGTYSYTIDAKDSSGKSAPQASGTIYVDSEKPAITKNSISPNPFAPDGSNWASIAYSLSEPAFVTIGIYDKTNTLVRTLEDNAFKPAGDNTSNWNGKNLSGSIVNDNTYTYKISAVDKANFSADSVSDTFTVERSSPYITSVNDSPDPFKPTGGIVNTIKFELSEDANVSIKIYDSNNNLVKNLADMAMSTGANSVNWDGSNNSGTTAASGTYIYKIDATDGFGKKSDQVSGTITVDTTPPVISSNIVSLNTFSPINESTTIYYDLSKTARVTLSIYNASGALVNTLESNAIKYTGLNSATWDGSNSSDVVMPDGTYTYKITAIDMVGLSAQPVSGTITIKRGSPIISQVSDSPDPLKLTSSASNTIKYTLAQTLKISLKIFDSNNNLVKILVNGTVTAGNKSAVWNGTDSNGKLSVDGIYTYKISALNAKNKVIDEAAGVITVDATPPSVSVNTVSPAPFAPLGNNTCSISYNLSENAKITIKIYDTSNNLLNTLESNVSKQAGTLTAEWNGKNSSGIIVKDGTYTYNISAVDAVGWTSSPTTGNIVVQHSTPAINSVSDSPDPFKPDGAVQSTIQYALSEDANVTIKIFDASSSLIRTLMSGAVSAGTNKAPWDGKNDSGSIVQSKTYTYNIDAVNSFNKKADQVSGTITVDLVPPIINGNSVSPDVLSPSGKNTATITYNLSESANTTVAIYDSSNTLIKTLQNNTINSQGINWVDWDGKNSSSSIVKEGTYTYKITATDFVGLTAIPATGSITISMSPAITQINDSPDPFRPIGSNLNTIKFTLSKNANVTLKIYNNNGTTVKSWSSQAFTSGDCSLAWDGNNTSGTRVSTGTYTYTIDAVDSSGRKAEQASGTIAVDLTAPVINSYSISPESFIPNGSNNAVISYNLSESAVVTIGIYDGSNNCTRTLESSSLKSSGTNSAVWDGKDSLGIITGDGIYTYKIMAIDLVNLSAVPVTGTISIGEVPQITSVSDSPDPFNPSGSSTNTIKYTLSKNANVTVKIYDTTSKLVRTLIDGSVSAGANTTAWNGKTDTGTLAGNGTYTYKIDATDSLGRRAIQLTGTITIDSTSPVISNHGASPNPFTPKQ